MTNHLNRSHPTLSNAPFQVKKKVYDKSVKAKYLDQLVEGPDGNYFVVKGRRSYVWAHFLYNQNTREAKCKHCDVRYNVRDGSTSGMLRHMSM